MRLLSVIDNGDRRAAVLDGDRIGITATPGLDAAIAAGRDVTRSVTRWASPADVTVDAPLRPAVVLCAGQNYRDHLNEKAPVEVTQPEFFLKAGQTIAAPDAPCVLEDRVTRKLDYETELGVVIGRAGRHIDPRNALDHVFGYVVVNDLTARDRQVIRHADGTVGLALGPGKNFDGATRLGSHIVTADEVGDPQSLELTTTVNGAYRQRNTTASMIFDISTIIAYLSQLLTLQPGTIIATGTPGGTGWGMDPELGGTATTPTGCEAASYLAEADIVVSRIDDVGELTFQVSASRSRARSWKDQE